MTFFKLFTAGLKSLVRDYMALFWFLAFPIIFILLFGAIFSGSQDATYNIGLVYDKADHLASGMAAGFKAVKVFKVTEGTLEDELAALKKGDRAIVVEIPQGAGARAFAGDKVTVPIHYDAGKEQNARMLQSIVSEMLGEAERRIAGRPRLLEASLKPYQTEEHKYIDFLLPGILAMALMQLGLFGAFDLLSLREQKVLKGLGATPLPRLYVLGAEVLGRLLLSLVQLGIIVGIGIAVFGVNINGFWPTIVGLVILGAMTFTSMGYMLTSFSRTVESGQGLVQLVQFPMMFLSGIFFPVEIMPKFLAPVIKAIPLTYLGDALRQAMVGMAPQFPLLLDAGILAAWLVVSMIMAVIFWRWE
ncbi:MAG: ABC transporter permease [Patescibacteria group bacterium]